MKNLKLFTVILFTIIAVQVNAQAYKYFKVAVYCRAYEVEKMADPNWLTSVWDTLSRQLYVDRIYLETHRDLLIVPDATLNAAKKFFQSKGVEVAGGITYTIDESNNFQTFCYTNPENRLKVKEIAEHTAKHFDFFILDDFFFTSCKCDLCVAAKGEKSWTDFRLDLMKNAATDLVINPAKKINPKVQVIIKYPNWYEHFQGLGFNLEAGPVQFDGVYTGTETRDRSGNQHLQQYLGYAVFRYYENLKPGKNFGGWVDTGGGNPLDRYAEQLWITMFAKAPEITLFDIRQMNNNYNPNYQTSWRGTGTSFDFDEMKKPLKQADGSEFVPRKFSGVAGYSLAVVDKVLGGLGNPVGVKCYKPFHSVGEDFLQTYFGMIGIPVDIVPQFPENEPVVLLTETASFDKDIVAKIKKQLQNGKNVVATSGFYKAMQGKGIENIVEMKVTDRKASIKEFAAGWGPTTKIEKEIIIPQVTYLTNDSWELISARDDTNGWPILHAADFSKGKFYVLTIPDNFIDLYILPENVLNRIRETIAGNLPVTLEGPSELSLFAYDDKSFVVESFLDKEVTIKVLLGLDVKQVKNIETGEIKPTVARPAMTFRNRKYGKDAAVVEITIKPHSFKGFSF